MAGKKEQKLQIGYKVSAEQFGPTDLLRFACRAEELGFDSVFVSDHFQPWRHTGGHAPFSPAWLGAVGARTSRILLGTSVLTPTLRYHPAMVAQAFGTLGTMFPGRIILGVGTGEALNEVSATGAPWPNVRERVDRLRESVALIRQLWREERVSFEGKYFCTINATIYDRPLMEIPIFVAGSGPIVARFAGRVGDGFICTSGKKPEYYRDELIPNVRAGRQETHWVESRGFAMMIELKVSFDTDIAKATADTKNWAVLALTAAEKLELADPMQIEKLADQLTPEAVAQRWIVSADPSEQVERIAPYIEMGFRHLVFHAPGQDQERFLKLYADQVLPRLRSISV